MGDSRSHFYNKHRPNNPKATAINLSGWSYFSFLVFIAAFTWFPSNFIVVEVFNISGELIILSITLIGSILFLGVLLLLAQRKPFAEIIFLPVEDNFYKKCVEWESQEILLTLKNGKTYYGFLWKYPENPKSRHESQTISIVPCISGYREEVTKKVIWDTYYPEYKDKKSFIDRETIIPRSEIITFAKFNKEVFDHFYKDSDFHKKVDG